MQGDPRHWVGCEAADRREEEERCHGGWTDKEAAVRSRREGKKNFLVLETGFSGLEDCRKFAG
jgi:hypothetical protein